jgi:hypothetical protein
MLRKVRKALCHALREKINNNIPLTKMEMEFYDTYHDLISDKKKRKKEK